MVTKELLKKEIDNVREEYLYPLYKIIKTFETPGAYDDPVKTLAEKKFTSKEWSAFVDRFAGCLQDTPLQRGDQGTFEAREELI